MRRFILKIIIMGLIFFATAIIVSSALYSLEDESYINSYESDRVLQKKEYVEKNFLSFDTLFLGSSRTERNIDPHVFNEITKHSSFNAGVGGLMGERLIEFAKIVVGNNPRVERIFIEVTGPELPKKENYKSNMYIYSIDWGYFLANINHVIKSDFPIRKKSEHVFNYTRNFLYKYIGIGASKYARVVIGSINKKDEKSYDVRSVYGRGEESLKDTLGLLDRDGKKQPSRDIFLRRLEKGTNMASDWGVFYRDMYFNKNAQSKDLHIEYVEDYARKLEEQGVEVYFVVPPRVHERESYGIKKTAYFLEKDGFNVISLVDIDQYPEFYFEENYHSDAGHLNRMGARVYTEALANQYLSLISK